MRFLRHFLGISFLAMLAVVVLCLPANATNTDEPAIGVATVTADALRLRVSASTSARILDNAQEDEVVVVLEKSGNWYKVRYNLTEGYMHSAYLNVRTVRNVELGYGRVNAAQVNMRTGPGTSYTSLGKSSRGDMAYIIGFNRQWYKVIWNDKICYIRSDYLTLTEAPYENRASEKSPLFFRNGKSTGTAVSVAALKNSANYLPGSKAEAIIATAKKYIGVPYLWAGTTPSGFDCSGFVQYVFRAHGISLNRTAATQYRHGTYVSKSALRVGDLVFFQNTYKAGISHVGIYIGDGKFIHCSSSKGVTISSLSSSYYVSHYYGARRIL